MGRIEGISIKDVAGGAVVAVKVVPGASRDRLAGVLGDALKITTSAAPEAGKANAAVARILVDALGVGRRDVELAAGPAQAHKQFFVAGLTAAEIRQRLEGKLKAG